MQCDSSYFYTNRRKNQTHQYDAYRKVRNEMQQLMKAQKNMELYFAEDIRPQHTR